MTKSNLSIATGDVIQFDFDFDSSLLQTSLVKDMFEKSFVFGVLSPKSFKKKLSKVFDNIEIVGGSCAYFTLNKIDFVFDFAEKKVSYVKDLPMNCYGMILNESGHPFVAFFQDGDVQYVPYEAVSSSVTSIYRHFMAQNEFFVSQMVHNFLIKDVVESACTRACNYDIACEIPGNPCLNYIYLIFGTLGVKFPETWAEKGADEELFNDFNNGFQKVM